MRPIEETYLDVEPLVHSYVKGFQARYFGPYDEWLSEANWIFMDAYQTFDRGAGVKFATWLSYLLERRLTSYVRERIRQANQQVDPVRYEQRTTDYRLVFYNALMSLSEDAKIMAELILDMPTDIRLCVHARPPKVSKEIYAGVGLDEFLTEYMGWTKARISQSALEIMKALA